MAVAGQARRYGKQRCDGVAVSVRSGSRLISRYLSELPAERSSPEKDGWACFGKMKI